MMIFIPVFAAIATYMITSVNLSVILSLKIYLKDIRSCGSGNPGFTNFKRNFGSKYAWVILVFDLLKAGGRLSIITFHSLEDRMVKKRFSQFCEGCTCPKEFPVCVCGKTPRGELPFKFVTASEEELERNPRSRSATLRTIEKLHD